MEESGDIINTEVVKVRVESKQYKVQINPTPKKSVVWNFFSEIEDENGDNIDYVSCNKCSKILTKNKRTTSNLLNHPCVKKSKKNIEIKIEESDKQKITNACVEWTIRNCVPFSASEGDGFKTVVREIICIGKKYGQDIDIDYMLPTRKIVSGNVNKLYELNLPKIVNSLKEVKFVAITIGSWTDLSCIAITAQYMLDNTLMDTVLGVSQMQSGENIFENISIVLTEFELNINECVFVTDCGANLVSDDGLCGLTRLISCSDHILNNVLSEAFNKSNEVLKLCVKCSKLVKNFEKSSNLQEKLISSLKNECDTRWNSKLDMFKSIRENFNDICEILQEQNCLDMIDGIKIHHLDEIIGYLEHFDKASTALQQSQSPTLHLCYPYYYMLLKKSEALESDYDMIKPLKRHCTDLLEKLWLPQLKIQHKVATFLFPKTKKMSIFSSEEKLEVYDYVAEVYNRLPLLNNRHTDSSEIETYMSMNDEDNNLFGIFDSDRTTNCDAPPSTIAKTLGN